MIKAPVKLDNFLRGGRGGVGDVRKGLGWSRERKKCHFISRVKRKNEVRYRENVPQLFSLSREAGDSIFMEVILQSINKGEGTRVAEKSRFTGCRDRKKKYDFGEDIESRSCTEFLSVGGVKEIDFFLRRHRAWKSTSLNSKIGKGGCKL